MCKRIKVYANEHAKLKSQSRLCCVPSAQFVFSSVFHSSQVQQEKRFCFKGHRYRANAIDRKHRGSGTELMQLILFCFLSLRLAQGLHDLEIMTANRCVVARAISAQSRKHSLGHTSERVTHDPPRAAGGGSVRSLYDLPIPLQLKRDFLFLHVA